MQKLGVVAGAGELPVLVAKLAAAQGMEPVIVTVTGDDHADFSPLVTTGFALTQIESIIAHFTSHDVSHLVMVGKVERPKIAPDTPIDATSAALLREALPHGDDAALRAILGVIQQAGLQIVPLQALLPDQTLGADYDNGIGAEISQTSLTLALKTHKRLGSLDVGQAVIVQHNRVIAIEAAEGTDAMIARSAAYLDNSSGALFLKASKATQNKALDPPVVGLDTIDACHKAGIAGMAIEQGDCLLAAPLKEIEARCAAYGMRLISVSITTKG